MSLIRSEIEFNTKEIQDIFKWLTFKEKNFESITKIIKVDGASEPDYFEICITINTLVYGVDVTIKFVNKELSAKKTIKVFKNVENYNSLNYIYIFRNDCLFIFKSNISQVLLSYDYTECIENKGYIEANEAYIYSVLSFVKNTDDLNFLNELSLFLCRNIESVTRFVSDKCLQKLDYLGFEEVYTPAKYKNLKYDEKNITINIISFLIYCLKCIETRKKNIYKNEQIKIIAKRIAGLEII